MKPKTWLEKLLLPLFVLIGIVVVGLIIWKGTLTNQGAALQGANLIACPFNSTTPIVRMYSPNGGEVYYSGQTILAKWGKCHIPYGMTGTLVFTKVNGSGPATYGPYTVNASQTTYSVPPIPTLPGVFNGANGLTATYTATITYGATTDTSDLGFLIKQSPVGVKIINGGSTGNTTNTGSEITFDVGTVPLFALGSDIYVDKDVLINAASGTLGAQLITLKEYLPGTNGNAGAQVPLDAQIVSGPTLIPITPGITLLPGGTYKIPVGTQAQFKIHLVLKPSATAVTPYRREITLMWDKYSFSTSDTNGNLSEPVYQVNIGGWGSFFF